MRSIEETSGPWVGWSVQYNRKIHEKMTLRVGGGTIVGSGEDADGNFELDGNYDAGGEIAIVRRYTYCTIGPEGVGVPFLYRGRWDGNVVSGFWKPVAGPYDGGEFEMWPKDGNVEIGFSQAQEPEPVLG